jgi:hypothetical protein
VFNVDGMQNKQGKITHFIDLDVQTGDSCRTMHFFLTNLGEQKVILGYPWFAATQPVIDWARGWIAYEQLPVVLHVSDATIGDILTTNRQPAQSCLMAAEDRQTLTSKLAQALRPQPVTIPQEYWRHAHVFSEKELKHFPPSHEWDHVIELKEGHPEHMPGKIYALTQMEQAALSEFLKEHLNKGYIELSKSQFAAPFFFIKKKDRKL